MEKMSMKTMDIGFQTAGKMKKPNQTADVSGDNDFRKLLQNKNEDTQGKSDSKEVSKDADKDTTTDKTEAAGEKKPESVSKDKDKTDKTDSNETDTTLAEALIVVGMRERLSCGFAAADQEVADQVENGVSEIADGLTESGAEEVQRMTGSDEQATVQVQTETNTQQTQMPNTGRVQAVQPEQTTRESDFVQESVEVNGGETVSAVQSNHSSETQQQTQDFGTNLKEAAKTEQPKEKTEAQSEQFASEQAAAAAVKPETKSVARTEVERPVTAAKVYVEQPEELPEKVTDTMLAKLVEGVKEFEIHIEPVNLGKIAVKVLYEGNQATISIICSEKRAMDALSQNAREIGNIIERNLGGETTIIVEKQESDYLNQTRDENEQADQNGKQQKEEKNKNHEGEDAEQFLQKLRLGLTR